MSSRSSRPFPLSLIGLLLLLAGPPPGGAEPPPPKQLETLSRAMAEAERAVGQGEVQIAESSYRTVLLEGWLLLGALAVEAGDLPAAKNAFEVASVSAVEIRRAQMSLALVEIQLGNAQRAVSLLFELKKFDLSDAVIRKLIPRALMAAGQIEEALQEMEELHFLNPAGLENTYALARAYLGQQRIEEATALFAELVERQPLPETHVLIGRTYRDFGHWALAHDALLAALEQNPELPRANYYLGTVDLFAEGLDLLDEAMQHLEAELRVTPGDPLCNLYLGAALVEQRRYEEAVPPLEQASRLLKGRPVVFEFLGRSYLEVGRIEEAIAALRHGLEIGQPDSEPLAVRDSDDKRNSQLSDLHYQLARALRENGDRKAAAAHFAAAKQFSAGSTEGSRQILASYYEDEDDEDTIAESTWPLELAPVSGFGPEQRAGIKRAVSTSLAQAYFNLGVLQTKAGHLDRAAALYSRAAELEPDFPRLQYSLGTALFSSGQYDQATGPLTRARDAVPEDENLRRMLALAWFNSESYDKAADLLRDEPGRGSNPSLQYAYAVALVRSGRTGEAEPVFARLLAENADWPELNVLLGQAHAQDNDYPQAIRYLQRALELEPGVAEAQATLGDIFLRQGKLDEAEQALHAELRSHPGDVRAQYKLAVILELNRKPQEAVALLRPLLQAKPDLANGRYLLGKILLAQGAAEEARAQLEAAAALSPGDANIHYQLGQVYQRLGRREKARHAFDEYRRLKKESRDGAGP
jgi:tetratricopeptide (TPR) repeat protein